MDPKGRLPFGFPQNLKTCKVDSLTPESSIRIPLKCPVAMGEEGASFFGLIQFKWEPFPKVERNPLGNWDPVSHVPGRLPKKGVLNSRNLSARRWADLTMATTSALFFRFVHRDG